MTSAVFEDMETVRGFTIKFEVMCSSWFECRRGPAWIALLIVWGCASGDSNDERSGAGRDAGGDRDDAGGGNGGGRGGQGGSGGIGGSGGTGRDIKDDGGVDPGPSCGDSVVDSVLEEDCDDGNAESGDGCSATCKVETNYACLTPGSACESTVDCGDGFITGNELCDDRNDASGDGCSADCQTIEPGWACEVAGAGCQAAECGDGLVVGFEVCDDDNHMAGDGCDAACQLERDFACETAGEPCVPIVCGEGGTPQGLEQCDDANYDTGDGCSPLCQLEPDCEDGTCTAICGDGLKLVSEDCDDGNGRDGDGCSAECEIEPGFSCTIEVQNPVLPIVYRDFIGTKQTGSNDPLPGNMGTPHPDFEKYNGCQQQVEDTLDVEGKPVLASRVRGLTNCVEDGDTFAEWYRSDDVLNRTVIGELEFEPADALDPHERFEFVATEFFPLDGLGWNAGGTPIEQSRNNAHNFHFTSEVRYWFTYTGGERLTFFGDDDVWVFINSHLAVDIAGVHNRRERWILLPGPGGTPAGDTGAGADYDADTTTFGFYDPEVLDIHIGGTYEVVVYQAERHTSLSQYQLTLENFLSAKSVCVPECGDGIVTRDEVCDEGDDNSASEEYGRCTDECIWGPRCGDDDVQSEHEDCDDGVNQTPYGQSGCAPGCHTPAFCGDGNIDSLFSEECDDEDNDGGYAECGEGCLLGPRCGDGELQSEHEECDDGNRSSGDGCNANCVSEFPD